MRLELKPFQENAVDALVDRSASASAAASKGDGEALILSAPTGSGKTVVATAWMERLLVGGQQHQPDPEATFLWLTDQPELNEQTRRKLLDGSDVFDDTALITVEAEIFDQELFDPGVVYFLNTQKLSRTSKLADEGDKRHYTIWETIASTADVRPESFLDAADVRASGLLKDSITLNHPEDDRHTDFTLLADAANRLQEYGDTWRDYAKREKQPPVEPILVVQVEDGTKTGKTQLTRTDLEETLQTVEKVLGPLGPDEVAHSFQEGSTVLIGDHARALHYVAPSDIEDKTALRVVFFKRSLTTGWDCPRAEAMMSFRPAKDETLIAQLVGRMVRTPLARRASDGDLLNSVSLYLPYYDEEGLESVIKRLSREDPDSGIAGTSITRGKKVTTLERAPDTASIFTAARGLPMYKVERVAKLGPVRRLVRLGLRLGWDGLDPDTHDRFTTELVLAAVEAKAEELADKALDKHEVAINALPDDKRQLYRAIRRQGSTERPEPWEPPQDIDGPKDGDRYGKHIYVKKDGSFTYPSFNTLEKDVLSEELGRGDVVGWLRNEPNKPWAFSLNYERHGEQKAMYPDFIVFRAKDGSIVCDILEPHSQREADSVAKAKGLADFASKHGDRFGRIELIDEVKRGNHKLIKRLPLKQPKWQKAVKDTHTEGHLRQQFENAP